MATATQPGTATSYELADPDVRLMLEVKRGSAAAFEQLVRRYQQRLIAVLEHLVGHRGQPEDLAQEVFLRIYRSRESYEPKAKFSTWLFTIANNVARNARRSLARNPHRTFTRIDGNDSSDTPLSEVVKAASGVMPARQLEKAEAAELVRMAIDSLNERQKMVLLLGKFEHMSYDDIGAAMGLSRAAVKSLALRARCCLKDILSPYIRDGLL